MSNNVYLRKYLLKSLCAIMFFIILLCLVNKVEYNKYKYNTNQKINGIVAKIQEKYPEIGKEEIIEILNSNNKDNVFNEYGYDINKDSYINQNNEVYIKFNILKIFILLLSFMILIYLFVRYYFKRDNEIEKIIKCLEKINQKNYEIDMCNGPITGKMLRFALPLMLSSMLQLLFNAADIITVGKFGSEHSLAAVGSNTALINLLTNLFIGLSIGANVLVARFYGAKNGEELNETVHTAMLLSLISGLILTVTGVIFARYFLIWMKTPAEILNLATTYLKIYSRYAGDDDL